MKRNIEKEELFYSKKLFLSFSGLNKLLFSPGLYYKDYVLNDREERTDKHLIEGKLIHCLLFEPGNLNLKFNIVPNKIPTDSVVKVLKSLKELVIANGMENTELISKDPILKDLILDALKKENLYQSLKEDSARLEKIQNADNQLYWDFLWNNKLDTIDNVILEKCKTQVEIIKESPLTQFLFEDKVSDFELDPIQVYSEKYLQADLPNFSFDLHGIIDHYKIDDVNKIVTITDLKTTSKSIVDFPETVEYYKYWLQAAIYVKLVYHSLTEKQKEYDIQFKFIVIDYLNQVYTFDVEDTTLSLWSLQLLNALETFEYHYKNKDYSLPYEYLTNKIVL
jgi:hypothetical protein